jgi:8-amino-7-oxononanoate synthase
VDEAHAVGIFGASGKGLVYDQGLSTKVFARIITFGKALGTHGAAVLGSSQLRAYLINFSRSLIYTTAAPFLNHLAIKCAYTYLKSKDHQSEIRERIDSFTKNISPGVKLLKSRSAIQIIVIPGNDKARDAAQRLQKGGFDSRAILSPSVAEGSERLRICLHNHNSIDEIKNLCELLNQIV